MKSNWKFDKAIAAMLAAGTIDDKVADLLFSFYESYKNALPEEDPIENYDSLFEGYLKAVEQQCISPYDFPYYHERIRKPYDYYAFGIEFLRPMIDFTKSTLRGEKNLEKIQEQVNKGENVIFLANHQIEADPQAINLILEKRAPKIGEEMIFVAGERVLTDPLAIPFSLGCNLLCIYSKRYIDNPPEEKTRKQQHNAKSMHKMSNLLKEGGKAIYVAPSGGRDRMDKNGIVQVAPFDPQSIEMLYLMARKAKHPTHFYPLTLATYEVLPPPETIQIELGEVRAAKRSPIHVSIGNEIDMEHFPGSEEENKHVRRKARADYIYNLVCKDYRLITGRES